jgi:hypothetical protein
MAKGNHMVKYPALIALIVVSLSSCSPRVISSHEVTDTTSVAVKERIVEVAVPGETVYITDWIECDTTTNKPKPVEIKAKGKRAKASVVIWSSGEMRISGGCDSLQERVTVMDKEIFRLRQEKKVIVKTEYKVHKIDIINRWIVGCLLLYIIGRVVLKFWKPW